MILESIIIGFKYLGKMFIVGSCLLVCLQDNHMEMELFGHIEQEDLFDFYYLFLNLVKLLDN